MKDNIFSKRVSQSINLEILFIALAGFMIITQLFAVGMFSYLGIFNRHVADDYCESNAVKEEFVLTAVFNRYVNGEIRSADRYSNLLFVGLSELLGKYHYQILSPVMMLIWLFGVIWSISQFRQLAGIRLPIVLDYLAATLIVFFSVWQAPNRFQTFLWRSGMATHFAPLVFLSVLIGFVLSQINSARKPALWVCLVVFLSSFMVGGFSEPPTTVMIVAIMMLIPVVWRWESGVKRRSTLTLLAYSLAGFLLAFTAMFFSPGNVSHGNASMPALPAALAKTFRFTFDFLDDSVNTLPIPTLISILTSFLISFTFLLGTENEPLSPHRRRQIWMWLLIAPMIQYLLIAASFAPSAYGQSYPAERAQFLGRLIMTATLLLEGGLMGVLCAKSSLLFPWRRTIFLVGSLGFVILAFYPMRAGLVMLRDVPRYQEWASSWDLRESEIHRSIATGERNLVVRFLPTKDGVKEIDATTKHWVNRCAAQYYEVDSIRSVPMGDQ